MKRTILASILLAPALAFAQPKTPDEFFTEGSNQYRLGNFDKAIESFTKGFELEPDDSKKSAYILNIAQSYRQLNNCKKAQFSYKQYLSLKDADTKKPLEPARRKEIEDRIKELDECIKTQNAIADKPPGGIEPPPGGGNPPPGGGVVEQPLPAKVGQPKVISLRLVGGGSKLSTGELDVPIQASGALIGGYPLALNEKLLLELGAGFKFTPVPFEDAMGNSKSASMTTVMANASAVFAVAPKVSLRGELGLGLLLFSGVSESPFTDFAETTGTLSMPLVRIGISADFAITPNVIATVAPFAFQYSPGKDGLRAEGKDISSITAIDFMVGVGYRM